MFTSVPKRSSTFVQDLKVDLRNSKAVVYLDDGSVYGYRSGCTDDMKSLRGIVGSLVKKGIVWIELDQKGFVHPITKEKEPDVFIVGVFGEYGSDYKLKNLEVK